MEYIYLIEINGVLKIGKSKRYIYDRLKEYKNGVKPIIHLINSCMNCDTVEKELKDIFNTHFEKERYYGTEYYSGDINIMKNKIFQYLINKEQELQNKEKIKEQEQEKIQEQEKNPTKKKRILTEEQLENLNKGRELGKEKLREHAKKKHTDYVKKQNISKQLKIVNDELKNILLDKMEKELQFKMQLLQDQKENVEFMCSIK